MVPNDPPDDADAEIFLIEDNPGDARLVKEAMSDEIKDAVSVVHTGEEAIDSLHQRQANTNQSLPAVILLDWNLPDISGKEILSQLKTDPDYSPIPVIVLTGSASDRSLTDIYRAEANACISKPASPEEFDYVFDAFEDFWLTAVELPSDS